MNATSSSKTDSLPVEHGSGHGAVQLLYQPAVSVTTGRLAVWLFLLMEVIFFAVLIGTCLVIRWAASPGSWPSPQDVRVVEWLGALNTLVLIGCSVAIVFSVRAAQHDLPGRARKWLLGTLLLGVVFLGIRAFEYNSKLEHGIRPGGPRSLLYDRADLSYLAGLKANVDAQILELEKEKTLASGQHNAVQASSYERAQQHLKHDHLDALRLIRAGLVQWTQKKVGHSGDPMLRKLAIACLAYHVAPLATDARVEAYVADEVVDIGQELVELRAQKQQLDQEVAGLQIELAELGDRGTRGDRHTPALDLKGTQHDLKVIVVEKTKASTLAARRSSQLADRIAPLESRAAAIDAFGDLDGGINERFHLKLPMVIPGGNTWAYSYFLLTGFHALHVLGGVIVLLVLSTMQLDSTLAGLLGNVALYWHFAGIVCIFLFPLFYWFSGS